MYFQGFALDQIHEPSTFAAASHPNWMLPDGSQLAAVHPETPRRPFQFVRMLRRLPPAVLQGLSQDQLDAISDALIPDPSSHKIDCRVSIPFFGRRYYLTLLAGPERRSLARLAREAQLRAKHIAIFYSVFLLVLGCICFVGLVLLGYVTKSALGIDLIDGPSMLHPFVYPSDQGISWMEGMSPMQGAGGGSAIMEQIPKT